MPEIIVKLGDEVKQKYYLYKDSVSIGRAPENEIAIENLAVSRRHAEIVKENGSYVIEDLNSANGTFVNGVQVTRTEIQDKDVIGIGKHKLYFYNQQVAPMQMVEKTMLVTRPATTKATLRIVKGKQKDQLFELSKVENRIGRAADNEIRLGDWFISKHHAEIVRRGMVYVVRDLGSWRHTYVNGQIVDEQVLKPGDEVQFGPKIAMVFEVADGTAAREGSGRKPVELEGVDQPLPIAASDPNTPLPIAGAASVPAQDDAVRSNGVSDPQLDEGWEEDFDPQAYVDSEESSMESEAGEYAEVQPADAAEEPVEAAVEAGEDIGSESAEDEAWEDEEESRADSDLEAAEAEHGVEPIRLEDESSGIEAGWDEAGAKAAEYEEAGDFDAESFKAGASDSWSPDSAPRIETPEEDGDSVSAEAEEEVEWVADIEENAPDEPVNTDDASAEAGVASSDSEGLESGATTEDPALGSDQSDEDEADAHPETPEVAEASSDAEAEPSQPAASSEDSLVDSIMEEHGDAKNLDRGDIEVWVTALQNPSAIIRKQAQRRLQKLTGQVYDIEQ